MKLLIVHGKPFVGGDGNGLIPITNLEILDTDITSHAPDQVLTGYWRLYVQRDIPEAGSIKEIKKTVNVIANLPLRDSWERLRFFKYLHQYWDEFKCKTTKEQARKLLKHLNDWITRSHPLHCNVVSHILDRLILEIADKAKISLFSDSHRELSYYISTVKVMEPAEVPAFKPAREKKDVKANNVAKRK